MAKSVFHQINILTGSPEKRGGNLHKLVIILLVIFFFRASNEKGGKPKISLSKGDVGMTLFGIGSRDLKSHLEDHPRTDVSS